MGLDGFFARSDAFRDMGRVQNEMNRLFNAAVGSAARPYPAVNVWANSNEAILTAELPGMEPGDIHLSIDQDQLVLEGNRKEFKPKDGDEVHRQERAFGTFKRGIPLPFRVQADKIEAGFKNGILSVKLPRHEAEKPRKIQIAASA